MDANQRDSYLAWALGAGITGLTLLYMWMLGDPMLVYLMLVTAVMAVFPTYRPIVAFVSLYGVFRISLRHDPVSGNYMSFVTSVAEAIDTTVGGTAMIVTCMALAPALLAVFTLDIRAVWDAVLPALPLLTLVCTKYFVEVQADADLTQLVRGGVDHLRELAKNTRALTGVFAP